MPSPFPRRESRVRPAQALRRTAWGLRALVQPGAPTAPASEENDEDSRTQDALRILGVAMQLADILLTTGASANDAAINARRVARAFGLLGVEADVSYTSITLSWQRAGREPVTVMRVVRTRTTDYNRLQRAYDLAHLIVTEHPDIETVEERLRPLRRLPSPYRPWVSVASSGALAVGVCTIYHATAIVMAISFVVSCLVHLALGWLARRELPTFFCQAVGAAIPTSATVLVSWLQSKNIPAFDEVQPSLVVAAGIVLLLAGMSTVGAAQDSIDGYYVTASARTFEVVMLTLGIVAGLLAVLRLGNALGLSVLLLPAAPLLGPLPFQLLGAVIIAGAFAIGCHARPRTVVLCAAMGLLGWVAYVAGTALSLGPVGASAVGAFSGAVVATMLAPRLQVPGLALITAAIVPLMPGSMVYRGVLLMAEATASADAVAGGMLLLSAAGVGVALAAGTSLGDFVARPVHERVSRSRRRA